MLQETIIFSSFSVKRAQILSTDLIGGWLFFENFHWKPWYRNTFNQWICEEPLVVRETNSAVKTGNLNVERVHKLLEYFFRGLKVTCWVVLLCWWLCCYFQLHVCMLLHHVSVACALWPGARQFFTALLFRLMVVTSVILESFSLLHSLTFFDDHAVTACMSMQWCLDVLHSSNPQGKSCYKLNDYMAVGVQRVEHLIFSIIGKRWAVNCGNFAVHP